SPLARWQAEWVAARLGELGSPVELVFISTEGDQKQVGPIGAIGAQGVFTKELQKALLDERIDLAVHSLKDLPTDRVEGLTLAAIPPRGPIGDVLVAGEQIASFDALPIAATVGTGSIRRRAQLWRARPDLNLVDVRGNVDTRLRKVDEGHYDAIILAEAGLERLGLGDRIRQRLPMSLILPAVGQGALGVEARRDDSATLAALAPLNDPDTFAAATAERALLAGLRGGCLAPVAAWGRVERGRLLLTGAVLSKHGTQRLEAVGDDLPSEAEFLGRRLAESLIARGAARLIAESRSAL
ncbi:MAG TPA: hydroxymethylbilane synthase, partial [Pirellulales bacterium]